MATVNLSGIITPTNVVTASSTETLTNKTINGSNNTLTNVPLSTGVTGTLPIANGGTNSTATPTAGTIPYGTGTALAYSAAGTSGQILQSNGASAPSWVAPGGSPMVYLSTLTASNSATITYTGFDSTYFAYMVIIKNLKCSSASGPALVLQGRMSDASIISVNAVGIGFNSQAASTPVYVTNISLQVLAVSDNANTAGASGNLYFFSPSVASQVTTGLFQTSGTTYQGIGGTFYATGGFQPISSLACSGFRLSYSVGNISSGTVDIYGIKNS